LQAETGTDHAASGRRIVSVATILLIMSETDLVKALEADLAVLFKHSPT